MDVDFTNLLLTPFGKFLNLQLSSINVQFELGGKINVYLSSTLSPLYSQTMSCHFPPSFHPLKIYTFSLPFLSFLDSPILTSSMIFSALFPCFLHFPCFVLFLLVHLHVILPSRAMFLDNSYDYLLIFL